MHVMSSIISNKIDLSYRVLCHTNLKALRPQLGLQHQLQNLISPAVLIEPNFPIVVRKHRENYRISLVARFNTGRVEFYHKTPNGTVRDVGGCITSDYQ